MKERERWRRDKGDGFRKDKGERDGDKNNVSKLAIVS